MRESRLIRGVLPFLVCLCVVFIEISSFSVDSYAAESVVAGTSSTYTYSINVNSDASLYTTNVALPIEHVLYDFGEFCYENYFYQYFGHAKLFTASTKVYAYKIKAVPSSCTISYTQMPIRRLAVGTQADFSSGDVVWGAQINASNNHTFWFVSEYQNVDILMGAMCRCYDYSSVDFTSGSQMDTELQRPAHLTLKGSWSVTVTPYTEDDYLDEIYKELVTQTGQNKEMISQLTSIKNSNATIQSKVTQMYTLMNDYLPTISNTLNNIYSYLQSYLPKFDSWFSSINEHLAKIEESLTQGDDDSPPEDVSQDEVNNVISGESDLLNKNDKSEESLDVSLDANATGVVWSIVTDFLQTNSKVFGVYLSALSLGVICLILNR